LTAVIEQVREDRYKVSRHLVSLPHVWAMVEFRNGKAVVVDTNLTSDDVREWDKHAVSAVQSAILLNNVTRSQEM
jgi:hypothetical protein